MDLLEGYGSDESDDGSAADGRPQKKAKQLDTDATPSASTATDGVARKKKITHSRLPLSRPLAIDASTRDEDAPLRLAAELEAVRPSATRSLFAPLPAPKVTLGSEASDRSSVQIDLSEVSGPSRQLPTSTMSVLKSEGVQDRILEGDVEVPQNVASHLMFSDGSTNAVALLKAGHGLSQREIEEMRRVKNFKEINAGDIQDENWYDQHKVLGEPGLHKGKKVPAEMSMYDKDKWAQTTHGNPTRIQKNRNHINAVAQYAMDNEAKHQDRNAQAQLAKMQTQMRYGR